MWYSQHDPVYASQILGYNTDPTATIGKFGCVITSYGNMLIAATGDGKYTPPFMNQWGRDNGAFVAEGGIWIWSEVLKLGGVTSQGVTATLKEVNTFLAPEPNFAILQVNNGAHFVLGNKVNTIVDAADGRQKPMGSYGGFVNAHLFTATNLPSQTEAPIATSGALDAIVTINVPILNARAQPTTASPVMAQAHAGTIHVNQWTTGQSVTINGRTDNVWLLTDGGHWIVQAGTTKG